MNDPPSVLIGIPTNGDMKMMTAMSLVMATNLLRATGHTMHLTVREGPYTHWNREHLVQDAVAQEANYLMFIDTDVAFPAEAVARLVGLRKHIAGGIYNLKQDEPVSTVKLWKDGQGAHDFVYGSDSLPFKAVSDEPLPDEPFQVAALPTGFMLVDVQKVFVESGLEFPYFPCHFGLGEDVAFCVNAQKAGLEVWCDPSIPIQHIGDKAY